MKYTILVSTIFYSEIATIKANQLIARHIELANRSPYSLKDKRETSPHCPTKLMIKHNSGTDQNILWDKISIGEANPTRTK